MTAQSVEPPHFTTAAGKPSCPNRIVSPAATVAAIRATETAAGLELPELAKAVLLMLHVTLGECAIDSGLGMRALPRRSMSQMCVLETLEKLWASRSIVCFAAPGHPQTVSTIAMRLGVAQGKNSDLGGSFSTGR
jgi:hypothetical protein